MISKWYFARGVFAVMLILIVMPYSFCVSQISFCVSQIVDMLWGVQVADVQTLRQDNVNNWLPREALNVSQMRFPDRRNAASTENACLFRPRMAPSCP
jgi:hypothetical protein